MKFRAYRLRQEDSTVRLKYLVHEAKNLNDEPRSLMHEANRLTVGAPNVVREAKRLGDEVPSLAHEAKRVTAPIPLRTRKREAPGSLPSHSDHPFRQRHPHLKRSPKMLAQLSAVSIVQYQVA